MQRHLQTILGGLTLCAAGFLTASPLHAATYYVAPEGNDKAAGSEKQPFATVQRGINQAQPGDTVLVRAGRYRERVSFPRSGEKGKPITLEGEHGALIDGGETVKRWEPAPEIGAGVYKTTALSYLPRVASWDDKFLPVLNARNPFWNTREKLDQVLATPATNNAGFKASGDGRWNMADWWDGVEAVTTRLNDVNYIRFRHGMDPNSEDVTFAPDESSVVLVDGKHFITIRGLRIRTGHWGIALKNANDCIVEDNFVSISGKSNILIAGSRNHVRHNELTQAYIYPDYGHPWNVPLHRRMWTVVKGYMWQDTMGIRLEDHGDDNHVYGNHVFRHFDGIGEKESGGRGTRVYNNIVQNIADDAFGVGGKMIDGQFHDNVVIESGPTAFVFVSTSHFVGPGYIYRNRVHHTQLGNRGDGLHFKNLFNHRAGKLYIYHNTIAGNGPSVSLNQAWANEPTSENILFVNNIFSSVHFYADTWQPKAQGGIGHFDHNWCGGERATRLADKPHFGPGNITANDQFLWPDITNPSFLITRQSPVYDKGVDLSKPFTLFGQQHPALPGVQGWYKGEQVDMGAVQADERPAIPAAPSNLEISVDGNTPRLTWKDNADNETHFVIQRSEGGTPEVFSSIGRVKADSTSFTDLSLARPGTYHYRVWAIQVEKGAWYSPYSNVATAQVQAVQSAGK